MEEYSQRSIPSGHPKWVSMLLKVSLLAFVPRGSQAFSPARYHLPLTTTTTKVSTISSPAPLRDNYASLHQRQHPTSNPFARKRSQCLESRQILEEKLAGHGDLGGTTALLLVPALAAWVAFITYEDIALGFHATVDILSGHNWASVDGGAYLTDLIAPALTGPVASFISLLFGTLTSMTVGSLYNRQATMARLLGELLGDLRLLRVHIKTFPTTEYQQQGEKLIITYGSLLVDNVEEVHLSADILKKRREAGRRLLEQCMQLLHQISSDRTVEDQVNGRALDECYATVNRLLRARSSLVTTYENCFPIWHYGNLCILAVAILFIFLVLTDKTALLFLGGFQLRMCWSMLIGTLSMLVVVLYDLNFPLSGAFQILRPMQLEEFDVDEFVEARQNQNGSGTLWMTEDW